MRFIEVPLLLGLGKEPLAAGSLVGLVHPLHERQQTLGTVLGLCLRELERLPETCHDLLGRIEQLLDHHAHGPVDRHPGQQIGQLPSSGVYTPRPVPASWTPLPTTVLPAHVPAVRATTADQRLGWPPNRGHGERVSASAARSTAGGHSAGVLRRTLAPLIPTNRRWALGRQRRGLRLE